MTSPTDINNPTWWHRCTLMERYCTVLAAAAIFLCGVLTVAISVLYFRLVQNAGTSNICLSKGCVTAAHDILSKMDLKVDPCDNFYKFTCGRFIEETAIPDDKTSVSLFGEVRDRSLDQLRSIIDEPSSQDEARPYTTVKRLYQACMDKASIEEIGLTRIKQLLSRMGGWPVLEGDAWQEAKFTWKDTIYKFREEGLNIDYIFNLYVHPDLKNSSHRIINIDQAELSLGRKYLVKGMDENLVAALYSYMVDIACIFGADRERAVNELRESLQFEIKLAEISLPPEERNDYNKKQNLMPISVLQNKYPTIPWIEYLERIMPKEVGGIYIDDVINVRGPDYIRKLEILLSTNPKRVQANYLMWRAVKSVASLLNEEVGIRQLKFDTALNGQSEQPHRSEKCAQMTANRLGLAVGSMYVKNFFKEVAKKRAVMEIVESVREQTYYSLETVDWMDEKTRTNALEKAKAMRSHIAYSDELLDEEKLTHHYEKLHLNMDDKTNKTNYLEMALTSTKFDVDFWFGLLREPVNKGDWRLHGQAAVVNAWYYFEHNFIELPAAILQGMIFSLDQPNYVNYGGIGFFIGHEITHGFDTQGRQFDKDGNVADWWEPETKEAYLKKAQCIIHQYANYTAEQVGLKLNGVNTQGENIADNGGIKQAYQAYNSWARQHGEEKRLPGLERFSPQQMFWISTASTWCAKFRPEALKDLIITGQHSPDEFRIRGPLSNRLAFSQDFNCPEDSPMNPTKKCQVW